ncbi:uncharacterized protein LOC110455328 [Mizuhopecten yessoensis]|uniref:Uncharacterized protein n=1 Tax=Mizuhopecten yessoensis TaxID=6573 RepID=A0A210QD76_MIZYE|nr:uncharacterized protein LOC110455328 [Mizuhopecten yessoensis]OWF46686.1 hypothetical protein KP79_PYT21183 [Mizuhopecten yessoensis]
MLVLSSTIVAMIILSLSASVSSYATGYRKIERTRAAPRRFEEGLNLEPYEVMCSASMACGYAVCEWRQDLLVPDETCAYLLSTCHCPNRQECPTNNHSPSSAPTTGFNVFELHCPPRSS